MSNEVSPHGGESGGSLSRILYGSGTFAVCLHLRRHFGRGELPDGPRRRLLERTVRRGHVEAVFISGTAAAGRDAPAEDLAEEVMGCGGAPVISVAQAGRSRSDLLSALKTYRARGVENLLLVTGDHPSRGAAQRAGELFDLDSVQLLMLLAASAGENGLPGGFFKGCVVSPFKELESEQIWQYEKLARKVEAGAGFVVSQAGFDLRKCDELLRFCRQRGIDCPVVGSVVVADLETAAMIGEGRVPGMTIPKMLLERIAAEERDRQGRRARLRRAGRTVAALRGLGYRGVLLGGRIESDDVDVILEEAESHRDRWEGCLEESFPGEGRFYYFRRDERTGLNEDRPAALAPRRRPHPAYLLSWAVDYVAFGSWKPFFRLLYRACWFCDTRPFWRRAIWIAEFLAKAPIYGCRMCGDCTLYACGFLCCEAGCPKRMLNGPCGGSTAGWCEVHPGRRRCIWVTVYGRLKGTSERPGFVSPPIPPKDRSLDGTCSWINFCLGRDHRKMKAP